MVDISKVYEHRPDDGLPNRRVYVDGVEVHNVVYANTITGIVEYHPKPIQIKDGEFVKKQIKGNVKVVLKKC